ncbi:MAG: multiheme c-type cytochrome [Gemmatimonadaceae bacterium]
MLCRVRHRLRALVPYRSCTNLPAIELLCLNASHTLPSDQPVYVMGLTSRTRSGRQWRRRCVGALATALVGLSCTRADQGVNATFVGSGKCGECHAEQHTAWRRSQHAVAMQAATRETVLGDFDDASLVQKGLTSRFFRRGDRFVVHTEGPEGVARDFDVQFTFGVFPLQQYLVAFPGGRLQPLTLAWDARPKAEGGQRWFSLEDDREHGTIDELHWTGRGFNWNYMCADCHSTAVRKGYASDADTFHTTSSEISVGCESCHGPGSAHVAWGARPALSRRFWKAPQLKATMHDRAGVHWSIDSSTGNARRSTPRATETEIGVCAQCHSRRSHIADGYNAGASFFDYYDPFPLLPEFYYPDGQQKDEVYDYASFLQSRMYAFGVTCADCHDPHSQKLRLPGNAVCGQCHRAAKYDTVTHHRHRAGSPGAACAACHMPTTTYMRVDARHDHSIRVPRPDRSVAMGVPNACTQCHADQSPAWAAEQVRQWAPQPVPGFQRFAEAFDASERGVVGSADSLATVINDASQPAIVRASAIARVSSLSSSAARQAAIVGARDPSPIVRRWALDALRGVPPADRVAIAAPLLTDTTRMVRQVAASVLAPVADSLLSPDQRHAFDLAAKEFVASQVYNADRAENRSVLGVFYVERGRLDSAEVQFSVAVAQWPTFVDGYVNLAGVWSLRANEARADSVLRAGLRRLPDEPRLHHELGLSLARQRKLVEATASLARASALSHNDPSYAYPYAVVLNGTGHARDAVRVLLQSLQVAPRDHNVLYALSTFYRDLGDSTQARRYADELANYFPDDAQARALRASLGLEPH